MRSAASITTAVLKKHFVSELERIVDEGVKVKHSELADKIDKLLQNPEKISAKVYNCGWHRTTLAPLSRVVFNPPHRRHGYQHNTYTLIFTHGLGHL